MARLLVGGEWYDAVASEAMFEADFEEILFSQAHHLYPTFHVVKFKRVVSSQLGERAPDFALIDKRYRYWWVAEVELSHHPLQSHVEQQIAVFATANYTAADAAYIASRNKNLNRKALTEMMLGEPPRVLVIVNQAKPTWSEALSRYGALIAVAEVFRSERNHTILRINGDHPVPWDDIVSFCHPDPLLPMLVVESPADLGVPSQGKVTIWFQGGVTEWSRTDSSSRVWLIPTGRNPLPAKTKRFVLLRGDDGRLILEERLPGKERLPWAFR